jgi:hypothetical protein
MSSKKLRAPREAKTLDELCSIPRDNVGTNDHWIITDGCEVTLAAQRSGSLPTATVSIPRATFEAFIDWYNTGIWRKPRARKAAS